MGLEYVPRFFEGFWPSLTVVHAPRAGPLPIAAQDLGVAILYGTTVINVGVFGAWLYASRAPVRDVVQEEQEEFRGFHRINQRVNRARKPRALSGPSALYGFMERNFLLRASDLDGGRRWTTITSVFSHREPLHLVVNMSSMYKVGIGLLRSGVSPQRMMYLMIGGGLYGSFGFAWWEHIQRSRRRRPNLSFRAALGASGMGMAMSAALTMIHPESGNL